MKINLLSYLMYGIKLSCMKFQVCHKLISFFILKVVIECPEEIFKNLLSVSIYSYDNSWEHCPKKPDVWWINNSVTSLTKGLFQLLLVQAFQYN